MSIRLTTFGGLRVIRDERELDHLLRRPSGAALLVYLAVEERATRDTLVAMFWPESEAGAARHALRQALYRLRQSLGKAWAESHGHELRIGSHVRTDLDAFHAAMSESDPASAARLYRGSFLEGVHLADLPGWETWVDARRTACARAFRNACRAWVEERRSARDPHGVVEAAERWAAHDPLDDEAHHELIRALAEAGRRTDAIRQYEAYAGALEREELRPLDETVALVDGLREAGPLPGPDPPRLPARPADPAPVPSGAERVASAAPPSVAPEAPGSVAPATPPRGLRVRRGSLIAGLALTIVVAALSLGRMALGTSDPEQGAPGFASAELQRGEAIVLADFGSPAADPRLGEVVTDALRIDLHGARYLRAMEPVEVREILARMQAPDDAALDATLAREVALRGGAKAVIEGDVSRAGTGYLLTATLRAAPSGESLAAFRESAATDEELIAAIDRLSRRIGEGVGEPLASAEGTPPLAQVTTSSLDALRLMSAATRASDRGDYPATIALLEEALELDPDFAMAWRSLGVTLRNTELDRGREMEAVRRAYELREHLSARERLLAAGRYHSLVRSDQDAMIAAYRSVLTIDPRDRIALNTLGAIYHHRQEYDAAADLFRRAVEAPAPSAVAFYNLIEASIARGDMDEARRTVEAFAARHPENPNVSFRRFWVLLIEGDEAAARREMEPMATSASLPPGVRAQAHDHLARLAVTSNPPRKSGGSWAPPTS